MNSSEAGDSESDRNYSDDEDGEISYNDYYNMSYYNGEYCDIEQVDMRKTDPEYFAYDCLSVEEVERLLNESVEVLSNSLQITPSLAKVLLHTHEWAITPIINEYRNDASRLLISSKIKSPVQPEPLTSHSARITCPTSSAALRVAISFVASAGSCILRSRFPKVIQQSNRIFRIDRGHWGKPRFDEQKLLKLSVLSPQEEKKVLAHII
ncbi:E3 ubiquitin-protein ligase arih2 [Homalodisca vitripennis]|nr:E3 ubiquitin-protein ligase arih2 [Homalodisca vitripennis]